MKYSSVCVLLYDVENFSHFADFLLPDVENTHETLTILLKTVH